MPYWGLRVGYYMESLYIDLFNFNPSDTFEWRGNRVRNHRLSGSRSKCEVRCHFPMLPRFP